MGEPMATRLHQAGHEVLVWARRPERAAELEDAGLAVGTLEEVLARPVVVSCLRDAAAVRETLLDNGAASSGLRAELVIEHSTVDPATSRTVAAALVCTLGVDPGSSWRR
jgi:3-hydroxyisobutyrate dehydrogenase-like beta-hydroxyacid dehydrogenase